MQPFRSALYIPGSNARALDKARGLACDAILFDLEDAVAPEDKVAARATLATALRRGGYGRRVTIVRINGLDTDWGREDAAAVAEMDCDGVLLPKVDGPEDVDALAALVPGRAIWVMIETAQGVLNARSIAAHDRVAGLVIGTNDLAKELRTRATADRAPLRTALQTCVLAARAGGAVVLDGVFNAFRDDDGLRRECEQGRDFGMDGKTLIHPAQIAVANEVFAPSPDELDLARRQIAAYEAARSDGQGIAVLEGRIVENLHVAAARATLDRARAIRELEGA